MRYGTFGGNGVENVQPFVFRRQSGAYATAHNGNIVNARELTAALSARGVLFSSSTDSELFGALIGESLKMGADCGRFRWADWPTVMRLPVRPAPCMRWGQRSYAT